MCRNGISEATSLRIRQQRIFKKILNFHFGHGIKESSKALVKFDSVFMPCVEHSFSNAASHAAKTWCQSLKRVLKFYFRRAEAEYWVGVKKIEVCMGEGNGNSSYFFAVVILFRHVDNKKEPFRSEVTLGKIN